MCVLNGPLSWGRSQGSPPSFTCLAARSLWHAGQICSFPSPEQSVAPRHCGKSTGEPGLLLSCAAPFRELSTWLNTLPACFKSKGQIGHLN
ncbi:rCG37315, isoform CRA_b [Rattus norvegicus]|uniref:RCG37315, isoform CRA_b n=1 Tax=Rattus norvegicus TaxID=10116 RepID=A6KI46_RAT|nr:rCG37315, isoform CRA_b [Rattus norvegicus]